MTCDVLCLVITPSRVKRRSKRCLSTLRHSLDLAFVAPFTSRSRTKLLPKRQRIRISSRNGPLPHIFLKYNFQKSHEKHNTITLVTYILIIWECTIVESAPVGMMAFFKLSECPEGWEVSSNTQGRLIHICFFGNSILHLGLS